MPITALPPTTVRAIGSTSVISDPCSVVKELLDNSLDASATSISIEISSNAIDVIQVKDNGHGIPSGDHALVCKRTFTSKIQTVEDLRTLGGKSLGFRGEALASAAEVSGGVTITTRIEEDMVGTTIKYGRNGELIRYLCPSCNSGPMANFSCIKLSACIASCGHDSSYNKSFQAHSCSKTICFKECHEDFNANQKAYTDICYGTTFETTFIKGSKG